MKKRISMAIAVATAAATMASVSVPVMADDVNITIFNSKMEVQSQFEELAAQYAEETGVGVEVYYNSDTVSAHLATRYSANDPYTIAMVDPKDIYSLAADHAIDLSDQSWVNETDYAIGVDGQINGFPTCLEARGVIYNADAIEAITGETFNPDDYKTLDSFKELLKTLPFDFVIGSSHVVHGYDPYYGEFFENREESACYREYFESILANVQTFDNYSIYGHLDYAVRYCPSGESAFRFSDYADVFEAILKTIIEHGKGIEINTGSLYKNMTYAHPHPSILKLYKELGGEIITVGSDAHIPKYIGYDFETYARDILTATGFRYYCTFEQMKPVFHKL